MSPAGTIHMTSSIWVGNGEPQTSQKTLRHPSANSNRFTLSCPQCQLKFSGLIQKTAFEPVPDTFLHLEQWHFPTGPG